MGELICLTCGRIFDNEDLCYIQEYRGEYQGHEVYQPIECCPFCKSDDKEPTAECDACGNTCAESSCEDGICDDCKEKALSNWQVIYDTEELIDDAEALYINPLVYAVMGESALQEIVYKAFVEVLNSNYDVKKLRKICEKLMNDKTSDYARYLPQVLDRYKDE